MSLAQQFIPLEAANENLVSAVLTGSTKHNIRDFKARNAISGIISAVDQKIMFDDHISGISGYDDLAVVKLSADEYAQMLEDGTCLSNAIYIVEAPTLNAFKQRIINVAPPVDLSDAATKEYVDNAAGGSDVQVSADYQTGTRVATISVDSVPTSIYVPSSGGSSRYALETAQLVADSGSLTCAVNDQAITTVQVSSSSTPIVVQLPAQPADGARDFILRIEISSSVAPTFTFNGAGETIDFDSEDDDWAVMEPGLNLVSFTETKRNGGNNMNSGGNNVVYHTVTFDPDQYGSFIDSSDATRQVADGEAVGTLPDASSMNYSGSFRGWYTGQDGTGTQVTSSTIITDDVVFYAYIKHTSG